MNQQKYRNNYNNDDCIHKRSCRYILQGLLRESKVYILNSLTLPAENFVLENKLLDEYPVGNYYICEINKKIYNNQIGVLKPRYNTAQNIIHINGDVLNLQIDSRLNFIWLDLCGFLTESLFENIKRFLSNNTFNIKGVFAITLLSARENTIAQKFFNKLQKEYLGTNLQSLQNFRNIKLPIILGKILKERFPEYSFELSCNYSYKPSSGGAMMKMYAFSWRRE
jgi:hypothetical protein